MGGRGWRHVHMAGVIVWLLLAVPTVVWWRDSILWVALMMVYALVMQHFTAWQAARVEEQAEH